MRLLNAKISPMVENIIVDGKPTLYSGCIKSKRSAIYVEL